MSIVQYQSTDRILVCCGFWGFFYLCTYETDIENFILDVVTSVFRQFETGLREGVIDVKVNYSEVIPLYKFNTIFSNNVNRMLKILQLNITHRQARL